ncbi:MAG: LLM class flavin-dependent oxidoreductase [Actinobacteria bacterium]|nr:LLM class flavin-dependent oxidoreductase [Actinomycetota bacterium]
MNGDRATRQFTIGFVTTAIDTDTDGWRRLDRWFGSIEAAGADEIWLTDHLFAGHPCGDPFVLAAVAATATSRCRIGTGVLQLALRRAAAVAKATTTLQAISGGRFRLGVGVGAQPTEFSRARVDFTRRGELVDRMLVELAEFGSDGDLDRGDRWFAMRPNPPFDIWVGGTSPAALHRTARFASGWIPLFLTPRRLAEASRALDAELVGAGRTPSEVTRCMTILVCPTDASWTRAAAFEWVARQFPRGTAGVDRYLVTGSLERCVAEIREFVDVGVDGIALQIMHPDPAPRFADLREALRDR